MPAILPTRKSAASFRRCRSGSTRFRRRSCSSRSSSTGSTTPISTAKETDPALAHYRPWLRDTRAFRPHQLSDEIEKLLHEKYVAGRAAWTRLFDETIADLRFPIGGKELTEAEALDLLSDRDPEIRREAALVIGEVLGKNARTFALITNTLAKDKEIEDRWRGFARPISSRNLANFVEDDVVDALIAAVRDSYPRLAHRYYKLKAGWFGVEALPFWDRNAPLPEDEDRQIPWPEAEETVLSAYSAFSPELAAIGGRFFAGRWIDAPVRPGKASGAFAHPTVPSAHPYLLLNYQGRVRDVMTLAHELGHGVHQVLAGQSGLPDGGYAVDPSRDGLGLWRDADFPRVARARDRSKAAQDHARRQGRGHAEHGGSADRLRNLRDQGS